MIGLQWFFYCNATISGDGYIKIRSLFYSISQAITSIIQGLFYYIGKSLLNLESSGTKAISDINP